MSRLRIALSTALAILSAAGCSDPAAPTTGTTKDISGTLPLHSSVWHTVTAPESGALTVTLKNLSGAGPIRLALGDSSLSCKVIASNGAATAGISVSATVAAGSYCVIVSDPGQLAAPVSYNLTVALP